MARSYGILVFVGGNDMPVRIVSLGAHVANGSSTATLEYYRKVARGQRRDEAGFDHKPTSDQEAKPVRRRDLDNNDGLRMEDSCQCTCLPLGYATRGQHRSQRKCYVCSPSEFTGQVEVNEKVADLSEPHGGTR
jgi:hypothetical protein